MTNKRGQVSFYILIGILILIGVLIFFLVDSQEKNRPLVISEPSLVPKEVLPVKKFVEDCVEDVTDEGVRLLASQGGYIYMPDYIERDSNAYIQIDPLGIVRVPLWFYQGRSRMPEIIDMEEDLSKYVNEQLPQCLDEFEVFDNSFTVEQSGPISTLVSLTNQYVLVNVLLPLEIEHASSERAIEINTFNTKVSARLKRLYDYSREVMIHENEKMFLENITLDLMAMNPDVPFTGLHFDCRRQVWELSDIREDLQGTFHSIYPQLRFEDTTYLPFMAGEDVYDDLASYTILDIYEGRTPSNRPDDAYERFHYLVDASDSDYKDLTAGARYEPEWGLSINARPQDNGRLIPQSGTGHQEFLRFLCFRFHHFTYDLSYPVMILVNDADSYGGQGLTFRFGTPVQIVHNAPNRDDLGIPISVPYGRSTVQCDQNGEEVDIRVKGNLDGFDHMEIGGVHITYDCFRYKCELGETESDGGLFRLRTNLPEGCSNGYYILEKEGYLTTRTQQLEPVQNIDLQRIHPVPYRVLKHDKDQLGIPKELEGWDSVAIHLKDTVNDYDIYAEYTLTGENDPLEFVFDDVTYVADILLFDSIDNLIYGGYQGNLTITRDDIRDAQEVVLNVVEWLPKPFTTEDNVEMAQYLKEGEYLEELAPVFQ